MNKEIYSNYQGTEVAVVNDVSHNDKEDHNLVRMVDMLNNNTT